MGLAIGLALGGGAARGWAHIGVIETLCDAGLEPRIIAGTSMGALVGGAFAAGRLEALRDWALAARMRTVTALADLRLGGGGLVEGGRIVEFLAGLGLDRAIETLDLPYAAVATHLRDGREIWLRSGPLNQAIRASIAMPGIFGPWRIEGRWLADGGLVNKVPVSACRALGAEFIIAVSVTEGLVERHTAPPPAGPDWLAGILAQMPAPLRAQAEVLKRLGGAGDEKPDPPPGYFAVLAAALDIMQDKITRARLAGEPPHAMIAPRVPQVRLLDFDRAAEVIEAGRAAARAALPGILAQLGR